MVEEPNKASRKMKKLQTNSKLRKFILGSIRRIRKKLPVQNISVFTQDFFWRRNHLNRYNWRLRKYRIEKIQPRKMESLLATCSTPPLYINWVKKSLKRWTIIIIHHLMMMRWNLWQFRNKYKYDPNTSEAIAEHNDLNYLINIELTIGPNDIQEDCLHLFHHSYLLEHLSKNLLKTKLFGWQMYGTLGTLSTTKNKTQRFFKI